MIRLLAILIVAACVVDFSHGLTSEEVASFGTTGHKEQNTGLVGWVKIFGSGSNWIIQANGIPDHDTHDWPWAPNPNSILEQDYNFQVPMYPAVAAQPSCIPLGPIGVATNGLVFLNPWTVEALNAVEGDTAETFDLCDGHPAPDGAYHYHKEPSSCLFSVTPGVPSPMLGVAFDGFAIYGPVDEYGNTLKSADLDECHGRFNSNGVYQYHTTTDFPYILGCYKGTPSSSAGTNQCYFASDADEDGNIGNGGGGPPRPPPPGRR